MPRSLIRLIVLHARLDREVRIEQRQRAPDGFRLIHLKKLRLSVRDRLAQASRQAVIA
jgi:hypothetical protein